MTSTDDPVDARRQLVSRILTGDRVAPVALWLDEIARWNARVDLTAARDPKELVDLMVADAHALSTHFSAGMRVVDVGSGAGAPGLALALLCDGIDMTLVEPMQKRATFLRMCIGKLDVAARIRVLQRRGEDVTARFDVALSRATLAPDAWLSLGATLAPTVWVLLAKGDPPERADLDRVADHRYRWPLTGAERRIVCYRDRSWPTAPGE
jgi:16S rRNA (guanine527-N7)-methyltransferase